MKWIISGNTYINISQICYFKYLPARPDEEPKGRGSIYGEHEGRCSEIEIHFGLGEPLRKSGDKADELFELLKNC